jgi:hypothetical protein
MFNVDCAATETEFNSSSTITVNGINRTDCRCVIGVDVVIDVQGKRDTKERMEQNSMNV